MKERKKQSETGRAELEVNIEGYRIIHMDRLQNISRTGQNIHRHVRVPSY